MDFLHTKMKSKLREDFSKEKYLNELCWIFIPSN